MVDLKRMAQRMKLHRVEGTVVHHCALLVKFLAEEGVTSRVIHGYCVSPNEICEHYWVRVEPEGLDMDIGYELACMYSPELMALKTVWSRSFPKDSRTGTDENRKCCAKKTIRDFLSCMRHSPGRSGTSHPRAYGRSDPRQTE